MNGHLNSEQIEAWMAGVRTEEQSVHLRKCPECAGELARAMEPMEHFGCAVRSWSEQHRPPRAFTIGELTTERTSGWRPMQYAFACAALLIAVAVPVFRPGTTPVPAVATSTAVSDEALLQQVDLEVSRSVPGPMEPLASLMTADAATDSSAK